MMEKKDIEKIIWLYNVPIFSDIEDNCVGNPCKNGANCTDDVHKPSCSCTTGWKGDNCTEGKLMILLLLS